MNPAAPVTRIVAIRLLYQAFSGKGVVVSGSVAPRFPWKMRQL
jgi:hypothetical protein